MYFGVKTEFWPVFSMICLISRSLAQQDSVGTHRATRQHNSMLSFDSCFFKQNLLLYIIPALLERGWRHFQWLSCGSLKSCPISIIIILNLLLLTTFCVQRRTQPGRVFFTSLLFCHYMFSNSFSLYFPIWKATIK